MIYWIILGIVEFLAGFAIGWFLRGRYRMPYDPTIDKPEILSVKRYRVGVYMVNDHVQSFTEHVHMTNTINKNPSCLLSGQFFIGKDDGVLYLRTTESTLIASSMFFVEEER